MIETTVIQAREHIADYIRRCDKGGETYAITTRDGVGAMLMSRRQFDWLVERSTQLREIENASR